MQEIKHTQGPWSINNWPQPDSSIAIGATGTPLIARVQLRDVSINEHNANARLIAAAPELLDALGYCESWFATHHPTAKLINGHSAEHPMLTCIRAAIANATMTGPCIADLVESGALPPPPRMDGQQHG